MAAICRQGANCWRVERADRFRCVQDGAEYFALVRQALLAAQHSVLVLGWDISGRLNLLPDRTDVDDGAPVRLDELLTFIVRRNRRLRCDILTWDYASLYTLERDPFSRMHLGWRTPRRVRFGYDDRHPIGASHHQKVVVVDDRLAFCGSIDLTSHRWDTTAHRVEEPARTTAFGSPYSPYHEVQAMVEGPVAASLAELARARWRALGDSQLKLKPKPAPARNQSLWPAGIEPDLTNVDVGIARTEPVEGDKPATSEVKTLFLDSIAAARRSIYIESQYFTSAEIGQALARRLAESDAPEVIVVTSKECHGWLEQRTMGVLREAVFQEMKAADRHDRLRLVFPLASRASDVPTFVHSKVMVVDDTLLRIGSANCAHRSLGFDTECDVAADAAGDHTAEDGIRRVRARLLAEHLGRETSEVVEAVGRSSMRRFIDDCDGGERTLAPIEVGAPGPDTATSQSIIAAADPQEPIGFGPGVERLMPWIDATPGPSAHRVWILPGIAVAAAVIAAWSSDLRHTEFRRMQHFLTIAPDDPSVIAVALICFAVAAALLVPIEVLILAAGVTFGFLSGSLVAFGGSMIAAAVGYLIGRRLGEANVSQWISRRSYRGTRQASPRGPIAFALFRLSTPAGAGATNLASGASRVAILDFVIGTALGLLPSVVGMAAVGGLFRRLILEPSIWNSLTTIGAAMALVAIGGLLRMVVLIRQYRPVLARHRGRAEFG